MGSELVRYEDDILVLTETVSDFANAVLNPLFGLGKLASRVLAVRAESKRLKLEESRGRWEHQERMQAMRLQAKVADQHSSRLHVANMKAIRVMERANAGEAERAIRQLESNYDLALRSIQLEGATRRHEIDQRAAVAFQHIDATLRADLQRLADARRKNDQVHAILRQQAKLAEQAQRDLRRRLDCASKQLSHPRFAPLAHESIQFLSYSMALTVKYQGDGMAAVAEALATVDTRRGGPR